MAARIPFCQYAIINPWAIIDIRGYSSKKYFKTNYISYWQCYWKLFVILEMAIYASQITGYIATVMDLMHTQFRGHRSITFQIHNFKKKTLSIRTFYQKTSFFQRKFFCNFNYLMLYGHRKHAKHLQNFFGSNIWSLYTEKDK